MLGATGTTYLEANLTDLSGQWRRKRFFSCSYAFVGVKSRIDYFISYPLELLNNSTATRAVGYIPDLTIVSLDWRIGAVNCSEAKKNKSGYACMGNSECVDFDASIGGYLCNCSQGYQGNPYLSSGCQGSYFVVDLILFSFLSCSKK